MIEELFYKIYRFIHFLTCITTFILLMLSSPNLTQPFIYYSIAEVCILIVSTIILIYFIFYKNGLYNNNCTLIIALFSQLFYGLIFILMMIDNINWSFIKLIIIINASYPILSIIIVLCMIIIKYLHDSLVMLIYDDEYYYELPL